MDVVNASHKVSCWKNVNEFAEIKKIVFDENSSFEDKIKALSILKSWKVRRGPDTPLGVLCTLILLDISIKDASIKDPGILCTLYGSALTKFINYATSFKLGRDTMYASANQLGIDSFLIDLRHNFAHGKQTFNLDVYRHSQKICMKWIKEFYWDREIDNILDVNIKDIRYDADLEEKLDEIFTFYDLLAELLLKNFKNFEELQNSNETSNDRWPSVKQFMKEKNLKNFKQAFKYFTNVLSKIITSREMRLNPKTFFHVMLTRCDLFMSAASETTKEIVIQDISEDDDEVEITPMKRPKKPVHYTIVNTYQNLIWHIAKNDYLKLFLDMLFQIYLNQGETDVHRKAAQFWIEIILKSYHYYQKYCEFTKVNVMEPKKISPEIRNIYSYQLDADLKNVLIFVGTQMLPSSLKYSNENVLHLLTTLNDNNEDLKICLSLMPLIYPPLTIEQVDNMKELIDIKIDSSKRKSGKLSSKDDKIYTVQDLQDNSVISNDANDMDNKIWKLADTQISWNSLPLAFEFKV